MFPLPVPASCRRPAFLAATILLASLLSLASFRATASELREDPQLSDYARIERMRLGDLQEGAPRPEAELRSEGLPPLAGDLPDLPAPRVQAPPVEAAPAPVTAPPPPLENLNRVPVCSVVTLESHSLDPAVLNSLTQVVWNEVRRSGKVRLLELAASRRILAERGMTPGDPFAIPPSRYQMAAVLQSDFLVLGNVNDIRGVLVLELLLYHGPSNSVVAGRSVQSEGGFASLLQRLPGEVRRLMEGIPRPEQGPSESAEAPAASNARVSMLKNELAQLRLENERLRRRLESVGVSPSAPVERPDEFNPPQAVSDMASSTLPPVRHGDKNDPRRYKRFPRDTSAERAVAARVEREMPRPPPPPPPRPEPTERAVAGPAETHSTAGDLAPVVEVAETPAPTPQLEPESAPEEHGETMQAEAESAPLEPEPEEEVPADEEGPAPDTARAAELYQQAMRFPVESKAALEPLRQALELDPGNTEYQNELVTRLYHAGLWADCARTGDNFYRGGNDTPNMLLFVGAAYYELGEYPRALRAIDRVLEKQPDNGYALFNRALNLHMMNDERAAEAFKHYLRTVGDDPRQAQFVTEAEKFLRQIEPASGSMQ